MRTQTPEQARTRAEAIGGRVSVAVEAGNYDWARAIIDQAAKEKPDDPRELPIADRLELPIAAMMDDYSSADARVINQLEGGGIHTIGQLLQSHPADLLTMPNVGERTLERIYTRLENIGFRRPSPR